jgi:phage shock protein PspC (stress-responsive transcriptional regulator)
VRLFFFLGTFATGTLLLWVYLILVIIMPKE